jgi:Concanavalin A-like lectin/glucanases superfamily
MKARIRYAILFAILISPLTNGMAVSDFPSAFNRNAVLSVPQGYINPSSEVQTTIGLVAYYPFNGNANDMSGIGNHGVVHGATLASDHFGNLNSAYSFDGVDDYIEMSYTPELNFGTSDFTISCWFYMRGFGDKSLVSRWQFGNWAWDLRVGWPSGGGEADKIYFGFGDSANILIKISNTVSANTWHHIVATRREGILYGYLDVVEFNAGVQSGNATSTSNLMLSNFQDYNSGFLDGIIDEVRIYNRALSISEISELYIGYRLYLPSILK